jgi:hypothetical protein
MASVASGAAARQISNVVTDIGAGVPKSPVVQELYVDASSDLFVTIFYIYIYFFLSIFLYQFVDDNLPPPEFPTKRLHTTFKQCASEVTIEVP